MLAFSLKPGFVFLNANSTGTTRFHVDIFQGQSDIWTEQRRVAEEPRGGEVQGR